MIAMVENLLWLQAWRAAQALLQRVDALVGHEKKAQPMRKEAQFNLDFIRDRTHICTLFFGRDGMMLSSHICLDIFDAIKSKDATRGSWPYY